MKAIISPHDAFCKKFLGNLEVARDFLKTHLPPAILEKCDLSTLKVEDCSFVDENLRQYFSDIVYSMQMNDGSKAYIQCIIEHQSNPKLLMTFRELRYCVGIWQKYFDKNPNEKLPIVVPILFYHGKRRPYPYSRDLMDCFVDPELAREIYTKPFPLVDISVIPDEEIMTHGHVALMELVQKHIYMRDMINIVGPIAELLNKGYTNRELFHALLYYITYQGETKNTEKFFKALVDQTPTYREDIMTITQQLEKRGEKRGIEQGLEQGMQQGMQQGEKKASLKIAKELLSRGINRDVIKTATGLSDQDIKNIEVLLH